VTASGATLFAFTTSNSTDWTVSENSTSLGSDPGLTLTVGRLYRFSKLISGHPLSIRNADNSVYTGVAGFPLNGVQSVDFTLPVGAPSTLRYVCDAHASMSGVITVVP
jgi:plastocyanin